jgi:ComF family protein
MDAWVYGRLSRRLLPEQCPRCLGATTSGFCAPCRGDFVALADACDRCGLPHGGAVCPAGADRWCVERVLAPYAYREPLLGQLQAFKYAGRRGLGRALGLLLVEAARPLAPSIDALVPVPLHARRLRERGYNQADELAKTLARPLGACVLARGISRRIRTSPQTSLAPSARHANLAGAFAVTRDLEGLRLGIVDDVITTGATVNALAAALVAAGAARVIALAIARTDLPGRDSPQPRNR